MCDGAVIALFVSAITDVRCVIESFATFFLEVGTGLITSRTGSALDTAKNNLVAHIGFLTPISMDTEVVCIIKGTLVKPVRQAVCPNFFGDGCRIFAEKACNVFKGYLLVESIFDIQPIFQCQMFLITRDKVTHRNSFHCCQKVDTTLL